MEENIEGMMVEVYFLNYDNVILDSQRVQKGSSVKYNGETPTQPDENGIKYTFAGWYEEDELNHVERDLMVHAKYTAEMLNATKEENALFNASLENAAAQPLNNVVEAGNKVQQQMKALEKDTRSPEEIVSEVMDKGSTELGQEQNKDDYDR